MTDPSPLIFVGGTGRSGTHIVAELLGHHPTRARDPDRVPLPLEPEGPLGGRDGRGDARRRSLTKLRRYWWHRVRVGETRARCVPAGAPGATARCAASTRSWTRPTFEAAARRVRGRDRRNRGRHPPRGRRREPAALLRPPRAAARRQAGPGRDELLHDRLGARARADLPRGALRPLGPRRPRLGLVEGLEGAEVPSPVRRRHRASSGGRGASRSPSAGYRGLSDPVEAPRRLPRRARLGRPRGRLRGRSRTSPGWTRTRRCERSSRAR